MIRAPGTLERFEAGFFRSHRLTHRQSLAILDGLWQEGLALGELPPKDPMAGVDVVIRVAAIPHSCSKKSLPVLLYGEPRLTRDIDVTLGVGAD